MICEVKWLLWGSFGAFLVAICIAEDVGLGTSGGEENVNLGEAVGGEEEEKLRGILNWAIGKLEEWMVIDIQVIGFWAGCKGRIVIHVESIVGISIGEWNYPDDFYAVVLREEWAQWVLEGGKGWMI